MELEMAVLSAQAPAGASVTELREAVRTLRAAAGEDVSPDGRRLRRLADRADAALRARERDRQVGLDLGPLGERRPWAAARTRKGG